MKKQNFNINGFEFEGYNYNKDFVILINAESRYILGRKFDNCISIGSGFIKEYKTLEEAKKAIDGGADIMDYPPAKKRAGRDEAKTKLKAFRQSAGLTQAELAEKAGINKRVLEFYEQGTKKIERAKLETILKICAALNCRMYEIIDDPDVSTAAKNYEV